MKIALFALLVGVCSLALAVPTRIPTPSVYGVHGKIADKIFLERQRDLLRLLRHVHQPNSYQDQVEIANNFDLESNISLFNKPIVVKEFIQLYRSGLLPRKEIFSVYNDIHRRQVIALFHLMYYANTYETFYKVCCYAREYVNQGMFVYALTVAVLHRPDCRGFVLPAPYEIYPYYFLNHEVIKQAEEYKMQNWAYLKPEVQQRLVNILGDKYYKYQKPEINQVYAGDYKYVSPSTVYQGKNFVQQPYVNEKQRYFGDVSRPYFTQDYQQVPYKTNEYYTQKPSLLRDYIQPLIGKSYYEQTPYEYTKKSVYEQTPFKSYDYVPKTYQSQVYQDKPYYEQKPFGDYENKQYYEQKPYGVYENKQYYEQKPYGVYENKQYYEQKPYTSYEQKPYNYGQDVLGAHQQESYVDSGIFHTVEDGVDVVYIPANYSGRYLNIDREQHVLSYFTEDIGLNSYYYYFHADYPFWMTGSEYGLNRDRRGELYYYTHQQLLARYYLERLSNGLGEIEWVNIDNPVEHVCTLQYENGLPFPIRPAHTDLVYDDYTKYTYERMNILEKRILESIDLGYVLDISGNKVPIYTPEGINILGNLIQGNADSVNRRYYGHLIKWAKILFGYSGKPLDNYKLQPSSLELYETALRDPMFYRIYKRIVEYFLYFKKNVPSYTYNDLVYPGVKIDSVFVDQLVTYFDYFNIELNNAVYNDYTKDIEVPQVLVKARQLRLNHKPFVYRINVSSDKTTKAVVRVFLGPKYNVNGQLIKFEENHINFVELDKFVYELKSGQNVIERNSRNFHHIVRDRTSYYDLYRKVMLGLKGSEPFVLDNSEAHCGFPDRLLLPKGTKGGLKYQIFVVVTPYQGSNSDVVVDEEFLYTCGVGSGARYIDNLPLGYPLDRKIDVTQFYTPNMYFQDVVIYHQPIEGVISTVVPQVPRVPYF